VYDLQRVDKNGISIDGVVVNDRQVEKAVETIYSNAVAHLPDDAHKRPFLVYILWKIQYGLLHDGLDGLIYCLNRLNEIAPTTFEKAQLLLLSQCDPGSPDDFMPLPDADWMTIEKAIDVLKEEKNGRMEDATELLRKLKAAGRPETRWYESMAIRYDSVERRESTRD
jgi:hypothetical protein